MADDYSAFTPVDDYSAFTPVTERESTALGAGLRGAGRAVVPTTAGMAAFGSGAALGGAVGGPAAPVTALLGGLAAAVLAGMAAGKVQEMGIEALPEDAQRAIGQDKAQRELDTQEHPIASFVGEVVPGFLFGRPTLKSLPTPARATAAQRAFAHPATGAVTGAGLSGGLEASREVVSGEDLDPRKIGIAAAAGALQNKQTRLGESVMAAGHGSTSPFVAKLYQDRGVDTTPSPDPIKAEPQPSPTVPRNLIRSGSVEEIQQHIGDNLGPTPNWGEVAELTKFRNSLPETFVGKENLVPAIDETVKFRKQQLVEQDIKEQTKTWKNAPEFEVVNSVEDIQNPDVLQAAMQEGADDPNALGFLGPDGMVRVFASRIDSPDTLGAVVYHEALGHYGLAQKFGDRLDSTITTLLDRNVGQFGRDVDAWMAKRPGAYGDDRVRAAEEVLAEMSNNGTVKKSVADAITAQIRQFARKMGIKLTWSDAEVRQIVRMGQAAVLSGKGRDVTGNGFRFMNDNGDERPALVPVPEVARPVVEDQPVFRRPANDMYAPEDAALDETPYGTTFGDDDSNRFMRRDQLDPKDVHEAAYNKLGENYVPKFRSWDDARKMAEDTPLSLETMRDRRDGVGNLDKKLFQYDNLAKEAQTRLFEIDDTVPLSAEDQVKLLETTNYFLYSLGRLNNDLNQIGRGLNAAKQIDFSRSNINKLKKLLDEGGDSNLAALTDPDTALKFLQQYKAMAAGGNPNGANQMLASVAKPYWWQYLLTYRQNMMLSGLSTHLKTTTDMAVSTVRELQESIATLPMSAGREFLRSMGLKNVKEGTHPAEITGQISGMFRAIIGGQAWRDSKQALIHGSNTPRYANIADPRIPVVSKVTDLIAAEDAFFRAILNNKNLYALGRRKAIADLKARGGKYSFDDIAVLGDSYAYNPTQGMMDEAHELTENTLLMNRSHLNAVVDKMRNIRPGMDGMEQLGSFAANFLLPFIRTASNAIVNQVVRRSPLGILATWKPLSWLDPYTKSQWDKGGPSRDLVTMKILIGSALIGWYWNQADPKKDKLTGSGPDSFDKIKELEAGGWRSNSTHKDGEYSSNKFGINFSFNPLGTDNNIANTVAGLREAYEKGANANQVGVGLSLATRSLMESFANQGYIGDVEPFITAATARGATGEREGNQFVASQVKTLIPNLLQQVTKQVDPVRRDTKSGEEGYTKTLETITNTIKSTIPSLSDDLPAIRDAYGNEVEQSQTYGPGNKIEEVTDPTEQELARLAKLTKAAIVTPVESSITLAGTGGLKVKLTPAQTQEYQMYAGQTLVQAVRDQMQSGEWQKLTDVDRIKLIRKTQTASKKAVREALIQQPDWLNERQLEKLRSEIGE